LYNNKNTYNNSFCGMIELLLLQKFRFDHITTYFHIYREGSLESVWRGPFWKDGKSGCPLPFEQMSHSQPWCTGHVLWVSCESVGQKLNFESVGNSEIPALGSDAVLPSTEEAGGGVTWGCTPRDVITFHSEGMILKIEFI
jgi:hypothetical protein